MANSLSRKDLLTKVYKMVPPMLEKFHKGQLGRVAVMGGSEDYTGAPYFSAMASAKLGADMSHVICEPTAAAVIKTYSPNLMVHPYMRQEKNLEASETLDSITTRIIAMLDRLHVLVIGPGLGRDSLMQETCAQVITAARKRNVAFVLDADGLYLVQTRPELVHGYKECILTPNVVEFGRLAKSQNLDLSNDSEEDKKEACARLARSLGGVTIIQKGAIDTISNGSTTLLSTGPGGRKRAGGQGDTLTGCLATLLAWRKAYLENLWEHEKDLDADELLAIAAFGGSAITRECSRLAFEKMGRSLQASDLTEFVHTAFLGLVGEKEEDGEAKL